MPSNELYLVVLPLIHTSSGVVEEVLTLLPDKEFATAFFPDEVAKYVAIFTGRASKYLTGGHVTGYQIHQEDAADGRFIVRVIQDVS